MRTDRPKPTQHKHVYDFPLENYFGITKISKNIDVHFYSLIASLDLSINAASSPQMYDFIRMCIQLGQSNPNAAFESLFSFNSRNTLRKNFCQYEKTNKEATLQRYFLFPFNSSVIDAGMNHGVSYLIAIVSNPIALDLKPLIISANRNFIGDLQDYKDVVINIIDQLELYNVSIGSITSDNLPVQKSAIDPESQNSFQFTSMMHENNYPIIFSHVLHIQ